MSIKFENLDFFDSYIEAPKINGNNIDVSVSNVFVISDVPRTKPQIIDDMTLRFIGVTKSNREVSEYIGNPLHGVFKKSVEIDDGPFDISNQDIKHFEFEGLLTNPVSWIGLWVIECDHVEIVVSCPPISP